MWASKRGGIQLLTQVLMCEWVLELPTRRTYVYASTYICEPEQGGSVTQTVTLAFDPRSADSALYCIVLFTYKATVCASHAGVGGVVKFV